jgi:hypothetical protein
MPDDSGGPATPVAGDSDRTGPTDWATEGVTDDSPVTCAWRTETLDTPHGDVTLVQLRLHNDARVPQRVRLTNGLDGPVSPPRRNGKSEQGWEDGAFEGPVPADGTRPLGYACPGLPTADPPVTVEVLGPAGETADLDQQSVARDLGSPRPPRAVVSSPPTDPHTDGERPETVAGRGDDTGAAGDDPPLLPPAVEEWIEAVERRVAALESLDGADVATATTVVDRAGGIEALETCHDADLATLRHLDERVAVLRDRAAAADPPLDALRGLA